MKSPDCVIWALTKRNNAHLVKFNGNQWSHSPLAMTGFHNASSSSSTINVKGNKTVDGKKVKRTFQLVLKHKMKHGVNAKKAQSAASQSKLLVSQHNITKEVNKAAKIVQGLTY